MNYLYDFVTLLCIYSVLAIGLNLMIGYTGIFSMSHAALFGIGAYTSALLSMKAGLPFLVSMIVAVLVATLFSAIISIPSLRIAGDYFIVASMSLQIIIFEVFVTWVDVTNGPAGLAGIPRPSFFGFEIATPFAYMWFTIIVLALVVTAVYCIVHSPFGRVLRAMKEDPIAVQSLGESVVRAKVTNAILSSALAGLAGSLYAHKVTYINPSTFDVHESILIAAMVILAGAGRVWGTIVGVFIILAFPELLRFMDISGANIGAIQKALYGLILVLLMMFRPQGIFGKFKDSTIGVNQHAAKN